MHIGGGPSNFVVRGLEPSGAGHSVGMSVLVSIGALVAPLRATTLPRRCGTRPGEGVSGPGAP